MMQTTTMTTLLLSLLLSACSGLPDMNPPQQSQAKLARTIHPAEDPAAAAAAGAAYPSGIWLAHRPTPRAMPPAPTWEVSESDKTLHRALARWAADAGWQLVWDAGVDYEIRARLAIRGSFEQAMGSVADSMSDADVPLQVIFYKTNKVVRIVAKGAE